jgi:hypothetical protein
MPAFGAVLGLSSRAPFFAVITEKMDKSHGNVFRLGCLYAPRPQNIDGRSGSRVVDPIPRPDIDTHFGNAFANRFAIAEIS